MPAVSKKQQRFFGMVRQAQKEGQAKASSPEVARVAASIKKSDAKDFASTKHKGLPEKKMKKEDYKYPLYAPAYKVDQFHANKIKLDEEEYDHYRDKQLERGTWKGGGGSSSGSSGKQPKGKTVLQKQAEKKYGKGKSALDMVKADIIAKHGKGAIMDTSKKKNEEAEVYWSSEALDDLDKLQNEAKVDAKTPDYKRATVRDKRYGNPHKSFALGGGIRKDRRADHEARRGVKTKGRPKNPYTVDEAVYTGPDKKDLKQIKKLDNPSYAKKLADYEKNMDPKKRQALKDKATKGMKFTHEETVSEVTAKERFKRDAGAIAKKKMRNKEHNKYVNFLDVDEANVRQRRSPGLQLSQRDIALNLIEKLKMSRKEYAKIHKDFKSDDPKKPRTTKYVPGKGTVSMPVELTDELHPNLQRIDAANKARVAKRAAAAKAEKKKRDKSAADFQAHKKSELAKGKKPHQALDSWQKKKMQKEEVNEGSAYGIYKGDDVDKVRNRAKKAVAHQRKGTHGDDHELDTEMKKTQKSVDKLNKVGERLRADTAAKKLEKKVKSLKKEEVAISEKIKYDSKGSSMDYFLGKDPKKTKYYKDQKKKKNEDCGCKHESFSDFLNEGNRTGRMMQKSKTQVTGHISADRGSDEKKNREGRKGLEKDLKKHGIGHKKGVGEYKYDSGETGREVSYQTSKPDKMSKRRFGKVMRRLGRKHGQESVITKDKDKPAKLHTTEKGSKQKSETLGKTKAGKHPKGYGETSGTKVRSGKLPSKTNKSSYHYS
ncbi:hypothetical protein PTIM40_113 [Cyanophage P-TIM40]|uniref:Uncharacterized protein n=1 Tax=Cyanophage P-TIM40 TaxID=1589733 RepID=A0A0C5AMW7_9CAUD|nr:hypothetical protein AU107_gp113 [Cyanophage P-TIM40]AJK27540.1 hypothetical protein PTIM40_113 [Cyanophage P-TIM40]